MPSLVCQDVSRFLEDLRVNSHHVGDRTFRDRHVSDPDHDCRLRTRDGWLADGVCRRDGEDKESRSSTLQKMMLRRHSCTFLNHGALNRDWTQSANVTQGRRATLSHRSTSALEQAKRRERAANYLLEHRLLMTPPAAGQSQPTPALRMQDAVPTQRCGVAPSAEAIRNEADGLLTRLYTVLSGDKSKVRESCARRSCPRQPSFDSAA